MAREAWAGVPAGIQTLWEAVLKESANRGATFVAAVARPMTAGYGFKQEELEGLLRGEMPSDPALHDKIGAALNALAVKGLGYPRPDMLVRKHHVLGNMSGPLPSIGIVPHQPIPKSEPVKPAVTSSVRKPIVQDEEDPDDLSFVIDSKAEQEAQKTDKSEFTQTEASRPSHWDAPEAEAPEKTLDPAMLADAGRSDATQKEKEAATVVTPEQERAPQTPVAPVVNQVSKGATSSDKTARPAQEAVTSSAPVAPEAITTPPETEPTDIKDKKLLSKEPAPSDTGPKPERNVRKPRQAREVKGGHTQALVEKPAVLPMPKLTPRLVVANSRQEKTGLSPWQEESGAYGVAAIEPLQGLLLMFRMPLSKLSVDVPEVHALLTGNAETVSEKKMAEFNRWFFTDAKVRKDAKGWTGTHDQMLEWGQNVASDYKAFGADNLAEIVTGKWGQIAPGYLDYVLEQLTHGAKR